MEGETFVIFAGLFAKQRMLRLDLLITVAWLGSFTGDQIYFYIGRRFGKSLMARLPRIKPSIDLALGWLERYNTSFILTYRFIYGVRNFSSIAMGMSNLLWQRFLYLNFIAAGLWAVTFAGAGYLFGTALGTLLDPDSDGLLYAIPLLVVLIFTIRVFIGIRRRLLTSKPPSTSTTKLV
jgi:membrane protein DedA with SNARE-associated domain